MTGVPLCTMLLSAQIPQDEIEILEKSLKMRSLIFTEKRYTTFYKS